MQPLSAPAGRRAARRLAAAPHPVLFLDVDGTLAPIVPVPSRARVPVATRQVLDRLARSGAGLVLVSGRAARSARRVAGTGRYPILGNHGVELLEMGTLGQWTGADRPRMAAVEKKLRRLLARAWPEVRLEAKGFSVALHHRLGPARLRRLLAQARDAVGPGVLALPGRRVIDVRAEGADKGQAVLRWLAQRAPGTPRAEVLYAGDDTTDEDAFRALGREAVTIAVGRRPHGARFHSAGPAAFARWLHRLARARTDPG